MAGNPLTTNLGPLTTGATAASSLASLALAIPLSSNPSATKGYQPLNPPQSNGLLNLGPLATALLFHYEGENTAVMESDITDHYVESNVAIQDQIGLKPEVVTVSGFIGELTNVVPAVLKPLQTIANTLVTIDAYTPSLSVTALNAYNQATLLYENATSIAQSAVSAWSSIAQGGGSNISGSGVFTPASQIAQNNQQKMFSALYGYWYNRVLFNVQTPWAIFTNMAIQRLRPVQDSETRTVTNYEVTFKKIRTANTVTNPPPPIGQGRNQDQATPNSNLGTSTGGPLTSFGSLFSTLTTF